LGDELPAVRPPNPSEAWLGLVRRAIQPAETDPNAVGGEKLSACDTGPLHLRIQAYGCCR